MRNTVQSSNTADQPASATSSDQIRSDTRYRRLCHAGRLICVLTAIGLCLSIIVGVITATRDFVAAPPSSGEVRPRDILRFDHKVGDTKCKLYVVFGENYDWPIPQLRIDHHTYLTITGVDQSDRSYTSKRTSKTFCAVQAWPRPGIAEHRRNCLPTALAACTNKALPELFYPGILHEPCAASTDTISRPLVALDAAFKLSWSILCLLAVVHMYRLLTHCLSGSILDRPALKTCKKILIYYTTMLILGPFALYVFNLMVSSGRAHILTIPYAGWILWLVLFCMYTLMRQASYLKSEVDATV